MRTTFDDIPELKTLGAAEPIVAPTNLFSGADGPFAVLTAAFREALIDGREPHSVYLKLEQETDPDVVLPPDVEIVRSAADDDDTSLLARGLGFTILVSTSGPVALVSAVTREQAQAVADGLRERARAAGSVQSDRARRGRFGGGRAQPRAVPVAAGGPAARSCGPQRAFASSRADRCNASLGCSGSSPSGWAISATVGPNRAAAGRSASRSKP